MAKGNVVNRPSGNLGGGAPMGIDAMSTGGFVTGWLQYFGVLSDALRGVWGYIQASGVTKQCVTQNPYNVIGTFTVDNGDVDLNVDVDGMALLHQHHHKLST